MKKLALIFLVVFKVSFSIMVGKTLKAEKSGSYVINCKVPVLRNFKNQRIAVVNKKIEKVTDNEIGLLKKSAESFSDYLKESETSSALLPFELFTNYRFGKNELDILSLIYEVYSYTGGNHGLSTVYTFNIDKKNEKILKIGDAFKRDFDYNNFLTERILEKIELENSMDNEDPEKIIFFDEIQIDMEKAIFYFEDKNLIILFPHYELAPYSSGIPKFSFPLDEIREFLSDEFIGRI